MAHAARHTLVTVEAITDGDLMDDPDRMPGVIPALYVTRIARSPRGAWPLRFADDYPMDEAALGRYVAAARTEDGFEHLLREWLDHPAPATAAA
jgi:glutaconate CoA-transferase subunit A